MTATFSPGALAAAAADLCRRSATVAELVGAALDDLGIQAVTVHIDVQPNSSVGPSALVSIQVRSAGQLTAVAGVLGLGPATVYPVGPKGEEYNLMKRSGDLAGVQVDVYCREQRS